MIKRDLMCGLMLVLLMAATQHVKGRYNCPEPAISSKHTDNALNILSGSTQTIESAQQKFVVSVNDYVSLNSHLLRQPQHPYAKI